MSKKKTKLAIVDVSSFIFRAFFAIKGNFSAPDGTPTNAVSGVLGMLIKLFENYEPTHVIVAKDTKGGSFRNEVYKEYKANRGEPPEDLIPQFGLIDTMIDKMKLTQVRVDSYEADDVIGSAAIQFRDQFDEIFIVSSDKDLMQFVTDKVKMLDTMKDVMYGPKEVFEKMGVKTDQIVDYLSMIGDASDNIPGLRGIGAKGASKLLEEYGTLENIIDNVEKLKGKRVIEAFTEHVEDAFLSKKLVTIVTNLNLGVTPDDFKFRFAPDDDLIEFLESLGFNQRIKKLKQVTMKREALENGDEKPLEVDLDFKIVSSDFDLNEMIMEIQDEISLFSPWNSTDNFNEDIKSLGIKVKKGGNYFVELEKIDTSKLFNRIFKNPNLKILTNDVKSLCNFALINGYKTRCSFKDITLAHFLLDPSTKSNIDLVLETYVDDQLVEMNEENFGKAVAQRAMLIEKAEKIIFKKLKEFGALKVYEEIDLPLVPILSKMEVHGVKLDSKYINSLEKKFTKEIEKIEEQIIKESGEDSINLNSPKQVSHLLFEILELPVLKKTKTGASTDSSVLSELALRGDSEIPGLILKYRELGKLLSTYVKVLPEMVNPKTKMIHTTFKQTNAATGRLSSDHPNLQNIPIRTENGRKIRKGFVAEDGHYLLSADYSQVELRLLAHLSGDKVMIDAFKNDRDIHAQTASEVFGIPLEKVSKDERSSAKAINFGLMYGQSSFGLSNQLHISRAEAKDYITMYFDRFNKVKSYLDELKESAEKSGYAETMFKRKRILKDINATNRNIKAMAERIAINSPIQGSAADIIKIAMINIDKEIDKNDLKSQLILQVHDELIFDVPEGELDKMKVIVKEGMENAIKLKVPLKVDMGIGTDWYDLK